MPPKIIIFLILISFGTTHQSSSQSAQGSDRNIIDRLQKINKAPLPITFSNDLAINNTGGHIQGIQHVLHDKSDYYVLSGSSDTYAYYAIVKTGNENLTISINTILEKPFKHAGGFQIYHNLMAIGVEDNDKKNKSKVFIFKLDNPEKPPAEPLAIIERMGTFKRATAGCVGITVIEEKVLVAVGDWDTEHLDFYVIDHKKLGQLGAELELEYSLNSKNMDKSGWIDDRWPSYQNINIVKDEMDRIYLAGLTSVDDNDVLDVFEIESIDLATFHLNKIYTRNFGRQDQTKFRWGAGIHIDPERRISVLSSGENIENKSILNVYLSP